MIRSTKILVFTRIKENHEKKLKKCCIKQCYRAKTILLLPKAENGPVRRTFFGTASSSNAKLMKLSEACIDLS